MVDGRSTSIGRKRPRTAVKPVGVGAGVGAGAESGADSGELSTGDAGDQAIQQENVHGYHVSSMFVTLLMQDADP